MFSFLIAENFGGRDGGGDQKKKPPPNFDESRKHNVKQMIRYINY